jgi:site-specific DNA-methyltransferase (adenine-specific)
MTRDTSRAAADMIAEAAPQLRSRIFVEIQSGGMTCDEIEERLGLRHQTASARVNELMTEGRIVDSGKRKETRSGAKAIVWVEAPPAVVPAKRYAVVYADPPWGYDQGGRGSTEKHYSTMSLVQIAALSVKTIAADDAVLFLWVTGPFLEEAFSIMKAWGFTSKTIAFTWVKYHEGSGKRCVGGGFWTRANVELCLLGVRGKAPRRVNKAVRQLMESGPVPIMGDDVLLAPRGKHSAKPEEARERIVELMGDISRIELFARGKGGKEQGWDQWGNECECDVTLTTLTTTENQGETDMGNMPQDMLDDIGKARTAGGGNYIQHGNYILMINKWFYQKIQDRVIVLECLVVDAVKKIVYEGPKMVELEPNAVGSECSSAANFDSEAKLSAPANSRAPVLGLWGFEEGKVDDQRVKATLDQAIGDEQPAKAMLVKCSTFPKEIRSKKGNYITGLRWECVNFPGEGLNSQEMVAARRAAFAQSTEAAVKLAVQQLATARASGKGPSIAAETPAAPAAPTAAPAAFSAPEISAPPVPGLPTVPAASSGIEKFVAAGWRKHPQNPSFWFLGQQVKSEADLIAGR